MSETSAARERVPGEHNQVEPVQGELLNPPENGSDAGEQLQIVAYCCQFCAYAAADLAGQLRMQYPPEIKVVHLPCSGKVDELLALHALEAGADGVMVVGCLPGDCHFLQGNLNAARRMQGLQRLLAEIGLEPERARMFNLSAAMAAAFVEATEEMVAQIAALGPSPLRRNGDVDHDNRRA
jgi:coenzyme F420-reducing hydrogenase delta subunit